MSEQDVHASGDLHIVIQILSREGVKPPRILRGLTAEFIEKKLSMFQIYKYYKYFSNGRKPMQNKNPCTPTADKRGQ